MPGGVAVDAVQFDERGYPQQRIPGANRLPSGPQGKRKLKASSQLTSGRRGLWRRKPGR